METVRYASLAQARMEVKETGSSASAVSSTGQTADDNYLLQALYFISARIDNIKGLTYAPYLITVSDDEAYYDSYGWHIDDSTRTLLLSKPLFSISSVTVNGTLWTADTDYLPVPRAGTPITGIRIPPSSGKAWDDYDTDYLDNIVVTGIGGFRRGYATAWRGSGDSVQNVGGITASATSITVTDTDGADSYNVTPRFSAGQLIRIGTGTDYREVLAVDYTTNTLTIRSSARGSTSTTQTQGAAISIWQPEEAIQRTCLRWVSYLYKRRGSFAGSEVDNVTGQTLTRFPPDIPPEAQNALDELPGWYIGEGV